MSKTYRDVVRGRYKHKDRMFDEDPNNKEEYWAKCYRWNPDRSLLLKEREVEWYRVTRTKIELQDKSPWYLLTHKEQMYIAPYSTPSHWNREFHTVPRRRDTRDKLRLYMGVTILDAGCEFMHYRKPHIYYW